MKLRTLLLSLLVILPQITFAKTAVVIDASDGGTEVDVQAALDNNPAGTTFLLKGSFYFNAPVFVEKSGTRILGEMIDDGDGITGPEDTWGAVIFGTDVGFALSPKGFSQDSYKVEDIEISGIRFELLLGVYNSPDLDCNNPVEPYNLKGVKFENNYLAGGAYFFRNSSNVLISSNFFAGQYDINPINLLGLEYLSCFPYVQVQDQFGNIITNNTFDSTFTIYSGSQNGLEISGNRMVGTPRGGARITLYQSRNVTVKGNLLRGDSTGNGLHFYARGLNPDLPPGPFSHNVTVRDNTFLDMDTAMTFYGGFSRISIKANHISQSGIFSPVGSAGIAMIGSLDNFNPLLTNDFSKTSITRNHIADSALTGVYIGGDTTQIRIVNNSFSNPGAVFGDILLAPTDLLFGADTCPAHGNTIIANNIATTVVDLGVPVCAGDKPNRLLGALRRVNKDVQGMPSPVQSRIENLTQQRIYRPAH